MSVDALLTETVEVVRSGPATTADEYGNPVPAGETRASWPARLEQLATDEVVRDRDTVVADWRMFLPAEADIGAYDRVEGRGHVFAVVGLPDTLRSPRGAHHVEVALRFTR